MHVIIIIFFFFSPNCEVLLKVNILVQTKLCFPGLMVFFFQITGYQRNF